MRFFLASVIVFIAYFSTAKLAQYIFFTLDTSPAVLSPAAGIALAAVFLGGYRMALPIALAHFAAAFTAPFALSLPVVLAGTLGNTLQPIIGTALLRRFGFDGCLCRTWDTLVLIGVAILVPVTAPALRVSAQFLVGALSDPFYVTLTRSWAGGMLSMMIITPLITTWFSRTSPILPQIRRFEAIASLAILSAIVYAVFWTTLPRWNVFVILYILFACLFWIGLRLDMSTMATAMFLLTALGIAGSIIAQPTTASLGNQLLADELFVLLIAPIFFILASLVEEKRMVSNALAARADELEKAMEKLSRDDKSKNEFIAILAHELRNPLAPVVSSLQLLRLRSLDEESRQLIIRAEQQTSLMRRLLDDLLDVARITRKAFKLHKETIDLRSIIERCVSSTEDFLRSRQHTLSVDLPDEPLWLYIDPVRVEQIIVNLLNNAAKYTDPGGRISISARVENRQAIIIVSDTGIGIEATALEKIFAPFRQLRDTPRVGSGLGIGLALTRSLIHMHSGTITARSEGPGKGSAFIVQFPIADPPSAAPHTPNAEPETEEGPMRILVVDDNFAAAESLSRLLEHYGHTVRVAHTGGEVVARVSVFKPDVILLDIGLPDIDGYEVARRLRKNSVSAFTIALTGYGQEEDKAQAFAAGFNYHLTKPVGIADIQTALGKYREGSEMEEEEPEEETR